MRFEWDEDKAAANLTKHGVSFEEARQVFADPAGLLERDEEHSGDEPRYALTGLAGQRLLFVVFTVRAGEVYRIIHARKATKSMARRYDEENS